MKAFGTDSRTVISNDERVESNLNLEGKMREEEGLPRARKEESPTSSTRPKPPTPRVSMMLKSDSFRLAKKAASASYLDFLMRKNGNFLEVQTREPRTTDPE